MQILNQTGLSAASLLWQRATRKHSLTVVVKGAFTLQPGAPAVARPQTPPPTGDETHPDDEGKGSHYYASDLVPFKPKADLLLVGHCHPPRPTTTCDVSFALGTWRKSLRVIGDRSWKGADPSAPERFERMPLRYERAFGGQDYAWNPAGRGLSTDDGLPNVELLTDPVRSQLTRPKPGGFGPIGANWAPRADKLRSGSYRGDWLRTTWPGFPRNFDWSYFNAAPEDQQWQHGYLRGDETFTLGNLIEGEREYHGVLPGLRAEAYLWERAGGDPTQEQHDLRPVELQLDTLWIDADARSLVLIWRGAVDVSSPKLAAQTALFVACSQLGEAQPGVDKRRTELEALLAPVEIEFSDSPARPAADETAEPEPPPPEIPDVEAKPPTEEQRKRYERMVAELGLADDDAAPSRMTPSDVSGLLAAGKPLDQLDLSGLALDGIDFGGASLEQTILRGASLRSANMRKSRLTGANLDQADLNGADLRGADITEASFVGADLREARLDDANGLGACFDDADLADASARGASFEQARLCRANLARASCEGATFTAADLDGAKLSDANLCDAKLSGASLQGIEAIGVCLLRAELVGARLNEARLGGADLRQVQAAESVWTAAMLAEADLSYAHCPGALFDDANLSGANLSAAEFVQARFEDASLHGSVAQGSNFFEAVFERADLRSADFSGASAYGAEFLEADTRSTDFTQANLRRTKLEGAT